MNRLSNKRVLVTGGTTGIGLETAKQFLAEGARVIVTGRNEETLAEARKALGNEAIVLQSDAGDIHVQAKLAANIAERFEKLDAVFVNAGVGDFRPLQQWDEAAFDRVFDINLKGPFFMLKALLPVLARPSSIILNATILAHMGLPDTSVYSASKAALLSLSRTLSAELAATGIRVNAISPGPISTPIYGKLGLPADRLQEMAEAMREQIPLRRFGEPIDIAKAAVFLASDESAFMMGSEVIVDGGFGTL